MFRDALAVDVGQHLVDLAITKFAIEYAYAQRRCIHQLFQNGVIRQLGQECLGIGIEKLPVHEDLGID
ncbi:hypothetical protein VAWG006_32440 [Aeromonas enteropelogenes]|nr:hypothetical protein VAWG006_32440 [Aeromonas enteropelogenes]